MESTIAFVCKQKHFVKEWRKTHARVGSGGGDWTCPACHINNSASRSVCFKCAAARPDAAADAATSGGGGGGGGDADLTGGGQKRPRTLLKQGSSAQLSYATETHDRAQRLRAPVTDPIDAEAFPYQRGNPPLTELKSDGRFFIRGVEYRLINKSIADGGYLGGGAFGKVWKAERVDGQVRCCAASAVLAWHCVLSLFATLTQSSVLSFPQPLHDVRDRHDRVSPLLNKRYICAKLFQCSENVSCKAPDARREMQMQARANYYVPGVMAVLAITPIAHGSLEGPVTLAPDAEWGALQGARTPVFLLLDLPLLLCLALLYTCAPRTHTTRSPSPRRPDWTRDAHSAQHAMGPHGMRARCAPIVAELGEASRRENAAWDSDRRYAGDQGRRQCARCSKVAHAHWFVEALVTSDAACALCFA